MVLGQCISNENQFRVEFRTEKFGSQFTELTWNYFNV